MISLPYFSGPGRFSNGNPEINMPTRLLNTFYFYLFLLLSTPSFLPAAQPDLRLLSY